MEERRGALAERDMEERGLLGGGGGGERHRDRETEGVRDCVSGTRREMACSHPVGAVWRRSSVGNARI